MRAPTAASIRLDRQREAAQRQGDVDAIFAVAALRRLQRRRSEAVVNLIGAADVVRAERERLGLRQMDSLFDTAGEPVGAPGRSVHAEVVAFEERVVPKKIQADTRVESEVEKYDRRDARLMIRTEGEEVVKDGRDVASLGRGDERSQWPPEHELADEVERRKRDARNPEQGVAGGGGRERSPFVVGQGAFGRGPDKRGRGRRRSRWRRVGARHGG